MFNHEKTEKQIMHLFALLTAIKASAENDETEAVITLTEIADEKLKAVWKEVSGNEKQA